MSIGMTLQSQSRENLKLCYTNTNCLKVHVKVKDIYVDNAETVDGRFNTSNHKVEKLIPIEKNKKRNGIDER